MLEYSKMDNSEQNDEESDPAKRAAQAATQADIPTLKLRHTSSSNVAGFIICTCLIIKEL